MRIIVFGLFFLLLLATPNFAEDIDSQALSAALIFTEIVDNGHLQAAYWSASPLLQLANAEQRWVDKADRAQRVLGKVESRQLRRIRQVTSPADLPDDDYRLLLFDARTERKAWAAEVILVHAVDSLWQVCAYSIR